MLDVSVYCLVLALIFNFVLFNLKKNKKNSISENSSISYCSIKKKEEEKKWSWINEVLLWGLDLGALVDFVDIRGFGFTTCA